MQSESHCGLLFPRDGFKKKLSKITILRWTQNTGSNVGAMRFKFGYSFVILAILVFAGCAESEPPLAGAIPTVTPATGMRSLVRAFADDKRLGVTNLTFLRDSLFVGTNVGLLRIEEQKVESIYRWYKTYNVTDGPWYGAHRLEIWMVRLEDRQLIKFDGRDWFKVSPPTPPNGFFGRGEFVDGYEGVGKSGNFYLVGGGHSWTWTNSGDWSLNPAPPAPEFSRVVGLAEVGELLLYVVQIRGCPFPDCEFAGYWNSGGQWRSPIPLRVGNVKQVVSASDAVFIRGEKGELIRVVGEEVKKMDTPGPCEAIARTDDGKLLASFTNAGIYRLDEKWMHLWDSPYPRLEGEHSVYLTEHDGVVALATASLRQLKEGRWYRTGSDALWLSDQGNLRQIDLVPKE